MIKAFSSYSFGCRVNQAEREALDRELISAGFVYSVNNPYIYIINTCAVTQKAEREARQLIYQTKRKFPKTKIIITGCAATKWINEGKKFPEVFRAIDNTNKEFIAQLIAGPAFAGRSLLRQAKACPRPAGPHALAEVAAFVPPRCGGYAARQVWRPVSTRRK